MGKPKIVIIGGGITGLSCAYQLMNCADVTIVESVKLGNEPEKGENKYIEKTKVVVDFFDELEIPYSEYSVRNGVILRGGIEKLEVSYKKLSISQRDRLNSDYYRKTRLLEPPKFLQKSFSEPSFSRPKKAIRTGSGLLTEAIVENLRTVKKEFSTIKNIGCKSISLKNKKTIYYDFLIFTIPLWEIRKYVWWEIPYCNALKRNVIKVSSLSDRYIDWDFIYTPYTPGNAVYRFYPYEDKYHVEINGDLDEKLNDVFSDLYFLFGDGWHFVDSFVLKGHMLSAHIDCRKWPLNITPLGMYAEWDEKITLDIILKKVKQLKKRWNL